MKFRITPCLIIITVLLAFLILLLMSRNDEGFKGGGGGFAMRAGGSGGGGMRGFGGPGGGIPKPGPPGPPPPPGRFPKYGGGVGWASRGIPNYGYFRDYPLAYSTSYALELGPCINGCCDTEQCRLLNGCRYSSNDRKYVGENPDSCIAHKKCVSANLEKLPVDKLELSCAKTSNSKLIE
jgi:hypothetical protein